MRRGRNASARRRFSPSRLAIGSGFPGGIACVARERPNWFESTTRALFDFVLEFVVQPYHTVYRFHRSRM